MTNVFPEPVRNLPKADIRLAGAEAFISQSENHQVVFMSFSNDVVLPEHFHECQWGIILEGRVELVIEGQKNIYSKGDRYFVPKGAVHHGFIYSGTAVIEYFNQKDRYQPKE